MKYFCVSHRGYISQDKPSNAAVTSKPANLGGFAKQSFISPMWILVKVSRPSRWWSFMQWFNDSGCFEFSDTAISLCSVQVVRQRERELKGCMLKERKENNRLQTQDFKIFALNQNWLTGRKEEGIHQLGPWDHPSRFLGISQTQILVYPRI